MKKIKLLALAMAVLMLSACAIGCEKVETVSVEVTVSVIADDNVYFGPSKITVEGPADNPPTVLQAAAEALALGGMTYETSEYSVMTIGDYADKVEGDYTYYWEYLINQEAPKEGRASTIQVQKGDVIVFNYVNVLTSELAAAGSEEE